MYIGVYNPGFRVGCLYSGYIEAILGLCNEIMLGNYYLRFRVWGWHKLHLRDEYTSSCGSIASEIWWSLK